MVFKKTKKMNVRVLKEQESQLSSKEKIERVLVEGNAIAFDIVEDVAIVGFAMLKEFEKGKFFLWNFAIDIDFQNQGLGTKALLELVKFLVLNFGCKLITTTYKVGNEHAKHVYEKVGFKQTDVVDEEGVHEVNMILVL